MALDPERQVDKYLISEWNTSNGLPTNWIKSVAQDKNGFIWFSSRKGIIRFDGVNFKIDKSSDKKEKKLFSAYEIYTDKKGIVWFFCNKDTIKHIDNDFSKLSHFKLSKGTRVFSFIKDKKGALWLGTNKGLFIHYQKKTEFISSKDGLCNNIILSMLEDSDANIWLGTFSGINRIQYMKSGKIIIEKLFEEKSINQIFEDKDKNIWITTKSSGIIKMENCSIITYALNGKASLVSCLYQDTDENIWAGSANRGLFKYSNKKFDQYSTQELKNCSIATISGDENNNLWIGTKEKGLYQINQERVKKLTTENGLINNWVTVLYFDSKKNLWIGTVKGLNLMKNGKIYSFSNKNGIKRSAVFNIYEDRYKQIIITSKTGSYVSKDLISFEEIKLLKNKSVLSTYQDQDMVYWFLTMNNGILRLKNKKIKQVFKKDGLPDNTFFMMVEDRKNNFWMNCKEGIYMVSKNELNNYMDKKRKKLTGRLFGLSDGMKSILCSKNGNNSILKAKDGKIWFTTFKGISVINPEKIIAEQKKPALTLKELNDRNSFYEIILYIILLLIIISMFFYLRWKKSKNSKKYKNSSLDQRKSELLLTKLMYLLDVEKIFTHEDITLQTLSDKLSIPSYQLSQLINEKLNKNFFDLINSSRIEEAKRLLAAKEKKEQKIINIAFDVGFRTETSFYKAFKKHTKMTPMEFKKKQN